jgi:hypothetical protein
LAITVLPKAPDWLKDSDVFPLREIMRLGPAQTRQKSKAEAALVTLMDHGWVERVEGGYRLLPEEQP